MNWHAFEAMASGVTAAGIIVGVVQLLLTKKINQTQFEDYLTREYREITKMISVKALLGEELTPEELKAGRKGLYCYIDLSNEQVFLRQKGRVSWATWKDWRDGIKSNLSRVAFEKLWGRSRLRLLTVSWN